MRLVRALIVLVLSGSYLSYVFHVSGGRLPAAGLGDWMDPYFINFLLEHWYQAVWSLADPSSPPMFFPARGTLGYSHALILYAPFYAAVRPFVDPFQAQTLTLILVMETGSISLYLILRRFLRLRFIESLLLTAFFLTSTNVINPGTAVWSQRASVFLIPSILLVGLISLDMRDGRLRLVLAAMFGLLAALLFTQELYTGLFVLLMAAMLLAGVFVCARRRTWEVLRNLWRVATARVDPGARPATTPSVWWAIVACVCLVAAAVIWVHPIERTFIGSWRVSVRHPTRLMYVALLTGGWFVIRRFDVVHRIVRTSRCARRMAWAAVVVLGPELPAKGRRTHFRRRGMAWLLASVSGGVVGVLVFVWIYLGVYLDHHVFPNEQLLQSLRALNPASWHGGLDVLRDLVGYESLRPFTLVFLLGSLAWIPWLGLTRSARLYSAWFLSVSAVVLLIPLRLGEFSIWGMFFAHMPGLSAVRDPKRLIYIYELTVVLLAGLLLTRIPRTFPRILIAAILVVLLVTGWNTHVFPFDRPNSVYRQRVEAPIDIDPSCRSFFVKGASQAYMSRSDHMWTLYGLDASFIALRHGIPTLNGYSAWTPDDWDLMNPQEPEYLPRVRRWIEGNALTGVCALDIEERTMTPFE